MTNVATSYANTDFDLFSPVAFDRLNEELSAVCHMLHYDKMDDGTWWATYEAERFNDNATNDILAILSVFDGLSSVAKQQLSACTKRDFNIGIHCWDSWGYNFGLEHSVVEAVSKAGCSISVTLYSMREPDGTPKADPIDG